MLANIYGKNMPSGGCSRPSIYVSMERWHEVQMESRIFVRCNKIDDDTFINAHGSFEFLESIGKVVSVTIFSKST